MSAAEFVAEARKLKGAKWRHRGRKSWGVDCVGLVCLSAHGAGMQIEDATGYGREPWEDKLRQGCRARFGDPLSREQAMPGDVALIQWSKAGPSHLAIIGDHPDGGLTLIHAHNLHGVVEHSLCGSFESVVVEVYRPWRIS